MIPKSPANTPTASLPPSAPLSAARSDPASQRTYLSSYSATAKSGAVARRVGADAAAQVRPLRDRLTRAVFCCSEACAQTPAASAALRRELSLRNIGEPPALSFALAWAAVTL